VVRVGNNRPLRKVPSPEAMGVGGNPPGESASHGAETTQSKGTVKAMRWRFPWEMVKRPTPQEQALGDGVKEASRPSRKARSRMLPETERGLLPRPGRPGEKSPGCLPGNRQIRAGLR
jgi:hypothetical protein